MFYLKDTWIGLDINRKCNLQCQQCNHFSNYANIETISYEETKSWIDNWSKIIYPSRFWFGGGEPFLNKEWHKYLELIEYIWPNCKDKILYTNGLLLNNHNNIIDICKKTNTNISITYHSDEDIYKNKINANILNLIKNYNYTKKYVKSSQSYYIYIDNIYIKIRNKTSNLWQKFYKNEQKNIEPFDDNNIIESYKNCVCPAPTIYKDRIYKCSPTAFLKETIENIKPNHNKWDKYLTYQGIHWSDNIKNIEEFFNKKEEWVCNMCPSNKIILNDKPIYRKDYK